MKITFDVTDDQKSILLVLAIAGPMSVDTLEQVVRCLSDAGKTIDALMRDRRLDRFRGMTAMEAATKAKKEGIDLSRLRKPISFVQFAEFFQGTPNLRQTIEFLSSEARLTLGSRFSPFEESLADEIGSLVTSGLVERSDLFGKTLSLTADGRDAVQRLIDGRGLLLKGPVPRQESVFVACAFGDEEIDAFCAQELAPVCHGLCVRYHRIDQAEPSTTITEAVLADIASSRTLIADLTYARPSVYFEAGFALSLGIPVLLTCRKDHFRATEDTRKVHFDLEQFKISFWERDGDGVFTWEKGASLRSRLKRMIEKRSACLAATTVGGEEVRAQR